MKNTRHTLLTIASLIGILLYHQNALAAYTEPASFKNPKKVITLGISGFETTRWDAN